MSELELTSGGFGTGWAREQEDHVGLVRSASPVRAVFQGELPPEFKPPLTVENQGQMGSCRGHATSSALELCAYLESGGAEHPEFSRMFSYLTGQKVDGLLGVDRGSTISGGIEAAKKYGICLEQTFPYPSRYATSIPTAATSEALNWRLRSHAVCQGYADCWRFLSAQLGGITIGIEWNESWQQPVIDSIEEGGGGHAMLLAGWSVRKDVSGRNYLWLLNSHGVQYAQQGWAEVAPSVIDRLPRMKFRDGSPRCILIGASDLSGFDQPRTVDWGTLL